MTQAPQAAGLARTVALLATAAFASSVSMRICDPLLPRLAEEFGVGLPAAASTITGFAVAYGVLQLAIGPLAERFGKYAMVNLAALLGAAASVLCALAPGLDWLVAARVLAGGMAGAIIPVALAWVGDAVPVAERQPVLARVMSGSLLGVVSGQLVGGVFVDSLGWRWAFVALALLFAAVGALLWSGRGGVARRPAAGSPSGPLALARGYGAIARPPWARRILATVVVEGLLMFGALSFIPAALHDRFGLPLWQAGATAAAAGAGGLLYTVLARRLIERLGERGLAGSGGAALCVGLLLVALAPVWWVALAGCFAMGLGFYSFHNTLQVHGTQLSSQQRAMGMALFALGLFVGQSIGVALVSVVVARVGFQAAFATAAIAFGLLAADFVRALARREAAIPGLADRAAR